MFLNLLLRKRLTHSSDDGSIKHLWNVGQYL
jgi:hypothetical protein